MEGERCAGVVVEVWRSERCAGVVVEVCGG